MWSVLVATALCICAAAAQCIDCARAAGCTDCHQAFDARASNSSADFDRPERTYPVAVKTLNLAGFFDCLDAPNHPSDQIIYAVDRQAVYIQVDMGDLLEHARRPTQDCNHVVTDETTVLDYLTFFHGPSLGGRSVALAAEDETIVGSNIDPDQSDPDPDPVLLGQPISPEFWAARHGGDFCAE